jgi:hypothetical protein
MTISDKYKRLLMKALDSFTEELNETIKSDLSANIKEEAKLDLADIPKVKHEMTML